MYDVEGVFMLLNSHDQDLMLADVENRKQSTLEEAEEPESMERTTMLFKLTEGLGFIEALIKEL
jgi:hypothetical protein